MHVPLDACSTPWYSLLSPGGYGKSCGLCVCVFLFASLAIEIEMYGPFRGSVYVAHVAIRVRWVLRM